ncbi:hypothetical protein R6242_12885 [Iodobacter sp. CM08]|uniref:hypothetical protein n=1 Tax=Iodobacter sp. CM08 TaxID=3085902 RepID=UPI00298297B8|nr:hypothetical protein [Iodobacter sp. CM08]MDW5417462.1 hypothetical protein [Iodobacter sp. CM08]
MPRAPRGLLSRRGINLRLKEIEHPVVGSIAKQESRSVASMCRLLILDGLAFRGIEIPEEELENIEDTILTHVEQAAMV